MVDKFNEKYCDLKESDKKLFSTLLASDFNSKKNLYNQTVTECVELINGLMNEADEESKVKLSMVKTKLLEETELNETNFVNKFINVVELKNNLEK